MANGVGLWCIATIEYNFPPALMEPLHSDEEQEHWADSMTTVCVSTPLHSFLSSQWHTAQQACHFQTLPFRSHRFIVIKDDVKGYDKYAACSDKGKQTAKVPVYREVLTPIWNPPFINAPLTAGYGQWNRGSKINYLSKYWYVSRPVYNLISNLSEPLFS